MMTRVEGERASDDSSLTPMEVPQEEVSMVKGKEALHTTNGTVERPVTGSSEGEHPIDPSKDAPRNTAPIHSPKDGHDHGEAHTLPEKQEGNKNDGKDGKGKGKGKKEENKSVHEQVPSSSSHPHMIVSQGGPNERTRGERHSIVPSVVAGNPARAPSTAAPRTGHGAPRGAQSSRSATRKENDSAREVSSSRTGDAGPADSHQDLRIDRWEPLNTAANPSPNPNANPKSNFSSSSMRGQGRGNSQVDVAYREATVDAGEERSSVAKVEEGATGERRRRRRRGGEGKGSLSSTNAESLPISKSTEQEAHTSGAEVRSHDRPERPHTRARHHGDRHDTQEHRHLRNSRKEHGRTHQPGEHDRNVLRAIPSANDSGSRGEERGEEDKPLASLSRFPPSSASISSDDTHGGGSRGREEKGRTERNILPQSTTSCTRPPPGPSIKEHKVILVAGVDGQLSTFNELAAQHRARAIIHTGNFGFYDKDSVAGLSLANLRLVLARRGETISVPLDAGQDDEQTLRTRVAQNVTLLSELPLFIAGERRLDVPLYVIWGHQEDVAVIEKFRKGIYHVPNLYIIDHRTSYVISTDHLTLRLFGLGGTFNYHRLFDVGRGSDAVSGGEGSTWANLIQMGELLDMADRYNDGPSERDQSSEVRLFLCQNNPVKEPLAHLLATELRTDFVISFQGEGARSCSLFEDATVYSVASLRAFLRPCREDLKSMWDQVYFACSDRFTEGQLKAAKRMVEVLSRSDPTDTINSGPNLMHISLPPCPRGQVKLSLSDDGNLALQAHSNGVISRKVIPPNITTSANDGSNEKLLEIKIPAASSVICDQQVPVVMATDTMSPNDVTRAPSNPPLSASRKATGSSSDFRLPSATSSVPAFYEDRRPGRVTGRGKVDHSSSLELYISNLPRNITGRQIDEKMLAPYDIQEILFTHRRPDVALVRFKSEKETERALRQLQHFTLRGHQVRISREDPDLINNRI